jgi:predicted amidohydrolase
MAHSRITVAAAQLPAHPLADAEAAWEDITQAADQAARRRVDLLVLPECAYPTYGVYSPAEFHAAKLRPNDRMEADLGRLAARGRFYLVAGVIEQAGDKLYNAAWVFDHSGRRIGTYRKNFLWDHDHDVFSRGDAIEPIDTELGRLGVLICADGRAPETSATLAARGAEIVAVPTNWVNLAREPGQYFNPQPEILIPARAIEFGQPHVCANKFGQESDRLRFCGQSRVVRPDGSAAAVAPPDGPAMLVCEIELGKPRPASIRPEWREALLSAEPPVRPPHEPVLLRLAVAPGRSMPVAKADLDGWLEQHRAAGVKLVIAHAPDPVRAYRWQLAAKRRGIDLLAGCLEPCVVRFTMAWTGVLPPTEAGSFAGPRVLALGGAELVAAFGTSAAEPIWRARAVENRVYVTTCGPTEAALYGPDGQALGPDRPEAAGHIVADLDLAQARDKLVAPRTDAFAERRPGLYQF